MANKNNTGMHKTTLDDHQPPASSWSSWRMCVTPQPRPKEKKRKLLIAIYAPTDSSQVNKVW